LVQDDKGTVEARRLRLVRLCSEAFEQHAPLSYEDLSALMGIDVSTVKELVKQLRERGFFVPTRGAVKDIGPEPSHKRVIAEMLGRGETTSQIRAVTKHSEGAIGRYQHQFALVLYLLNQYPDGSDEQRRHLSELSSTAYQTYCEVARKLSLEPECRPHLERLRRRFELDPEGIAHTVPVGKRRPSDPAQRLEQQTLTTAVRQLIQSDLATTPRVAEVVADDLLALLDSTYRIPDSLRPGEVVFLADAHDPDFLSGDKVSDRPVIPVFAPLYTDQVKEIWRKEEPVGRRRAEIATVIATAVWEQGAVMSVTGLAELLHTSPATLSSNLRQLAVDLHVNAPTKGLMEDAGPTLTHKSWIVGLDNHGLTGEEISWLTRHAPASRDRYIQTYRRAEALMQLEGRIPDPDHLARVLHLRRHVAKQYVDLLAHNHPDATSTQANAPTQPHQPTSSSPLSLMEA
jgi:Mn-dependent DtxR family transcriptional regulator